MGPRWRIRPEWIQDLKEQAKGELNEVTQPEPDKMQEALTQALNKTFPKARNNSKCKPIYWWNEDVAEAKRKVIRNNRRRRSGHEENVNALTEQYKEKRKR